jgi:hypothetical protein
LLVHAAQRLLWQAGAVASMQWSSERHCAQECAVVSQNGAPGMQSASDAHSTQ